MKAKFFVLEGVDGAGKTTQIKRLEKHFGDRILVTREPGGCPRAEEIRKELFAHPEWSAKKQFDKLWEARSYHLDEIIRPALTTKEIIISDRFDSTTFAYQIWEKQNLEWVELFWQKREEILGNDKPDLYIYLDINVEAAFARNMNQINERNHLDDISIESSKIRQDGYKEFFSHVPHIMINANRSEDEIFNELVKIIQ